MTSAKSLYLPPKLESMNKRTLDFQDSHIVPITLSLNSIELSDPDRAKVVSDKLLKFERINSTSGLLLPGTVNILRDPIFFANLTNFAGTAQGTVWTSGKWFRPKIGTIVVGAKCLGNDKIALLEYYGKQISIIQNEMTVDEKQALKIGDFYTIEVISSKPSLGKPEIAIEGRLFRLTNITLLQRYLKFKGISEITFKGSLREPKEKLYTNSDVSGLAEFYDKFDAFGKIKFDQLYKKLINPYELLYASRSYKPEYLNYVDLYSKFPYKIVNPVSRAYFKVMELIHFFNLIPADIEAKKALTLGDAPGGFAQCITQMFPEIEVGTVSLLTEGAIKYSPLISQNDRIKIEGLADGTGNLLKVENIRKLYELYSDVDFVGCDGALAYENKEEEHIPLLFAEILCALGTLKKGGSGVFKLYRIWKRGTIEMYLLLLKYFEFAYFYKCRSSRIASLETFFIGKGFRGIPKGELDELMGIYGGFQGSISDYELPESIELTICNFNTYYDEVVKFHHRLILEYHNYEGNEINREPFYRNQLKYVEGFFSRGF